MNTNCQILKPKQSLLQNDTKELKSLHRPLIKKLDPIKIVYFHLKYWSWFAIGTESLDLNRNVSGPTLNGGVFIDEIDAIAPAHKDGGDELS